MSQKYRRSKRYGGVGRDYSLHKITFEQQVREQEARDKESTLLEEREADRKRREELRKTVWEDDFEFGGAL